MARVDVDVETSVELATRALPELGAITGVLRSEVGDLARAPLRGPLTVVLADVDDADCVFVQVVSPLAEPDQRPGGAIGRFRFDAVPAGRYTLTVHANDFVAWSAGEPVAPGGDPVEVWRRDSPTTTDIEVVAVDRPTGERIDEFRLFVELDGEKASAKVLASDQGSVRLCNVPITASVRWTMRADGHEVARGDRRALSRPVALGRGWGNTLSCTDDGGQPIPGVVFALDGVRIGSTDAAGELWLSASRAPRRISLVSPGFLITGGDLRPDGASLDLVWGIRVVLARSPTTPPEVRK